MSTTQQFSPARTVITTLLGMTVVSLGFYAVHRFSHPTEPPYSYLVWNLFLAWLPLLTAWLLRRSLRHNLWSSWLPVSLSAVWLILLPNSFYMISDYIHLQDMTAESVLYGAVMFTSFIMTAAAIGFCALLLVDIELSRRFRRRYVSLITAGVLLVCSFAVYLGRDLRWNSWDVLFNPAGILFDISDRIIHPGGHPGIVSTTLLFFVLLSSFYIAGWQFARAARFRSIG